MQRMVQEMNMKNVKRVNQACLSQRRRRCGHDLRVENMLVEVMNWRRNDEVDGVTALSRCVEIVGVDLWTMKDV
jgi:hypothetical protein